MQPATVDEIRRRTVQGVLLSFLGYAVYALSDASVRALHGAVPPFELVFFGSLLGLLAVPFVGGRGEG